MIEELTNILLLKVRDITGEDYTMFFPLYYKPYLIADEVIDYRDLREMRFKGILMGPRPKVIVIRLIASGKKKVKYTIELSHSIERRHTTPIDKIYGIKRAIAIEIAVIHRKILTNQTPEWLKFVNELIMMRGYGSKKKWYWWEKYTGK